MRQPSTHCGDLEDIQDEMYEKDCVLADYFKYRLAQGKNSNHIQIKQMIDGQADDLEVKINIDEERLRFEEEYEAMMSELKDVLRQNVVRNRAQIHHEKSWVPDPPQ